MEMAEANAQFIRKAQLPRTERTTAGLSQALRVEVRLISPSATTDDGIPWPAPGQWQSRPGGMEAASAEVSPQEHLVLLRPEVAPTLLTDPSRLMAALLGFWALSLWLAWVLARRVVHPLRRLADRIPHIADESPDPELPEINREDEIGQLARSYRDTRIQLAKERAARLQAERLATLGRMATGLAHEINNPVAAIRLHAQLLEEEVGPELRERVQTIFGESVRIESLVSQWMFLARPQPPHVSPCDLAEVVSPIVRALQPSADHAGVVLRNETESGLWVNGDRRRLTQAISNVVANAIQAAANGRVTIRSEREKDGRVALQIVDSGRGFSTTALDRGTELFYSEKEGGMGVGLSVTSEILRAHGGEARLQNNPDGGANVTLVLPPSPVM